MMCGTYVDDLIIAAPLELFADVCWRQTSAKNCQLFPVDEKLKTAFQVGKRQQLSPAVCLNFLLRTYLFTNWTLLSYVAKKITFRERTLTVQRHLKYDTVQKILLDQVWSGNSRPFLVFPAD